LYQNKIFFHEFWMKFQRFSAELEYNNKTLLNDLQHKISSNLQWVTLNIDHLTKSAKTDYKLIKLASVKNICLVELLAHKL